MISGAANAMKDMEQQHLKQVGTETINGIATRVMEGTVEQNKEKVWVAQNPEFPVKVVMTGPDGKAVTIIEVKQLSFAKPPASALVPPAGCTAIQGEASAQGVHAEFGAGHATPGGVAKARVTAVHLEVVPSHYSGPCPITPLQVWPTGEGGDLCRRERSVVLCQLVLANPRLHVAHRLRLLRRF